ncbi:MAG: HAD family hydrolase [Candidatus Rokuibacteriota bacterium]
MKVRAVTVDFWGTLLLDPPATDDRHKARRLADFETILAASGVRTSRSDLDRAYRESGAFLSQVWLQDRDVPVEQHVRAILLALDPALVTRLPVDTMSRLVDAYARPALLSPPVPADGARAALSALAGRGYTLCLVSNTMRTPGAILREILRAYGLLDYFAHLTFSDECGIRKPDPEIFHRTLRAAGVPPAEAVHVGDDPVLDVEGARAAGMRVVQVTTARWPRGAWFGRQRPHARIPGLGVLPGALSKLDRA